MGGVGIRGIWALWHCCSLEGQFLLGQAGSPPVNFHPVVCPSSGWEQGCDVHFVGFILVFPPTEDFFDPM